MKHPVKIVRKITARDEKAHRKKSYPHAHRLGDIAEIELVGQKQFDYVNRRIQDLPKGHFAATHTQRHHVHISQEFLNLIPENMRVSVKAELKVHEVTEDVEMSKNKRGRK